MSTTSGIPSQAAIAINDMLDNVAQLQPGQQVLILAHVDGLYGGPNLVDEEAITWIQAAVEHRGAYPSVLWVDEPFRPNEWRMPRVLKAALAGADILINNSFDVTIEEVQELRETLNEHGVIMVRNFSTTSALLTSDYALTPSELTAQIRYQVGALFTEGQRWQLSHPNGSQLEGTIGATRGGFASYTQWRNETFYRPFPEWVHTPITLLGVEGILVFDRMLSWWSRYIGIPPFFKEPIRLTVERGHITRFEGGEEARALQRYMDALAQRIGEVVYEVSAFHSGVHPNAKISPHLCPNPLYYRLLDHQQTSNIHIHLGNARYPQGWPYMLHITADVQGATMRVNDTLVHDRGYLTVLDHPEVRSVAARYPDRPGLPSNGGAKR